MAHSSRAAYRVLLFGIVPTNVVLTSSLAVVFAFVQLDSSAVGASAARVQLAEFFTFYQPLALTAISTLLLGLAGTMWFFGTVCMIVPFLDSVRSDLAALSAEVSSGEECEQGCRARLAALQREVHSFSETIAPQQLLYTLFGAGNFYLGTISIVVLDLEAESAVSSCLWAVMCGATLAFSLHSAARVHSACSVDLLQACALRGSVGPGDPPPATPSILDPPAAESSPSLASPAVSAEQALLLDAAKDGNELESKAGIRPSPSSGQAAEGGTTSDPRQEDSKHTAPHEAPTAVVKLAAAEANTNKAESDSIDGHTVKSVHEFPSGMLYWVDVVSRSMGVRLGGVVLVTTPLLGTAASLSISVLVLLANNSSS